MTDTTRQPKFIHSILDRDPGSWQWVATKGGGARWYLSLMGQTNSRSMPALPYARCCLRPPQEAAQRRWRVDVAKAVGGQMRVIAFVTCSDYTHKILEHTGAQTEPPRFTPVLLKAPNQGAKKRH